MVFPIFILLLLNPCGLLSLLKEKKYVSVYFSDLRYCSEFNSFLEPLPPHLILLTKKCNNFKHFRR